MKYKNIILILSSTIYCNVELDSLVTLINQQKYLEVVDYVDEMIEEKKDLNDTFFKKASESAFILDEFDKSIQYLKKAIAINDNKDYRNLWDEIVRMRKDIEIALKMYTEENKFDESIVEFNKLKKQYPYCALIEYNLGKIYQQEELYDSAIENFQNAVKLNPYREKYKMSLNYIIGRFIGEGDEYYSMRDFESAIEKYLFAYENISNNPILIFKIAKTYYFLKEYDKSRDMLEVLVSISSDHYEGYKLLGDVYKRLGDKTSALEKYLHSIEVNDKYEKAYLAVGQMYYSEGESNKALEYLNLAIEIKKDYSKAYETAGMVYENMEDYTKAIYYYEQTVSYDRRNYKAMSRLSSVYNNLSKYDFAKKYAKDCIKIKRSYPDAYYELGIAEKGLGNRIAAISAFDNAKKSSRWRKLAQYEIDQIKKELD